jgi:hypothetical protein
MRKKTETRANDIFIIFVDVSLRWVLHYRSNDIAIRHDTCKQKYRTTVNRVGIVGPDKLRLLWLSRRRWQWESSGIEDRIKAVAIYYGVTWSETIVLFLATPNGLQMDFIASLVEAQL